MYICVYMYTHIRADTCAHMSMGLYLIFSVFFFTIYFNWHIIMRFHAMFQHHVKYIYLIQDLLFPCGKIFPMPAF
jgi:hypothetical protein